jgi:hypothetical protein
MSLYNQSGPGMMAALERSTEEMAYRWLIVVKKIEHEGKQFTLRELARLLAEFCEVDHEDLRRRYEAMEKIAKDALNCSARPIILDRSGHEK